MKKFYLSILSSMILATSFATVHTITNSGLHFTPDSLQITVGDTVVWNVGSTHPVLEVDQTEYDSNTNSGNGGFDFPSGSGTESTTFTTAGEYYYICTNHIGAGMKGKIIVVPAEDTSSVNIETLFNTKEVLVYPNPIKDKAFAKLKTDEEIQMIVLKTLGGKSIEIKYDLIGYIVNLDFTDVSLGIYILNIRTKERNYYKKLLIE